MRHNYASSSHYLIHCKLVSEPITEEGENLRYTDVTEVN